MSSALDFLRTAEFQADVERNTHRWDDEWVAYWGRHKTYAFKYFMNLREATRKDFRWREDEVLRMREREFYEFLPFEFYPFAIWVRGEEVPGSKIVELGCGPGLLGKVLGQFCAQYVGIDYSKLALYLARLVSPATCQYVHLSEVDRLAALVGSMDLCVGRFFFIHQNLANATWVMRLFHALLRRGGSVSADFYARPDVAEIATPTVIHRPEDPLDPKFPSCVFEYSEAHIDRLAAETGFEVTATDYVGAKQRRFVRFSKR